MMKSIFNIKTYAGVAVFCLILTLTLSCGKQSGMMEGDLEKGFKNPPRSAHSGVYWYFMDGNMSREGMTKDLESMVKNHISHVIFLEVNVGVPRGDTDMLSTAWKDNFRHAVEECERLGIQMTLGVGPGWTGSGGPWVKPEESMQHLVSSTVQTEGGGKKAITLPIPRPKAPFFGEGNFTPELHKQWEDFYEDVAVLVFPDKGITEKLSDSDEKAMYYRAPYSSMPGVKQFLPMHAEYEETAQAVESSKIIDVTAFLKEDGTLEWDFPSGKWTIMRFGTRNNGAITRPAPTPGLGFEADKFDTTAIFNHLDHYVGELLRHIDYKKRDADSDKGGITMLHMDSWEMGSQNWTGDFREQFINRRGYDPLPFYPAYSGVVVGSTELSERFLWDVRKTSQELILEKHAGYIKEYAHRLGMGLSIEPYDMNPTADLELAAIADVPMCEYWSDGYGFNTGFSTVEGSSLSHLKGQPVVPAEGFTAYLDGWDQYPGKIKNQTDWAFAAGVNRLMYHTFQHQCLPDELLPGMTMGPYGVHWDRNQTWWDMGEAYQLYVARSQFMLQQGRTVSDILYLCPEGNPHVFRAPESALEGANEIMPDKKGYGFDACPPSFLYQASVREGEIEFESGARYKILVLPNFETMTPELLSKVRDLINAGATVVGMPPKKSPSLQNYPVCDTNLRNIVEEIWGAGDIPEMITEIKLGKGKIFWGKEILDTEDNYYANYGVTSKILENMGVKPDFLSSGGEIRNAHRMTSEADIYFVSNRTGKKVETDGIFRITGKVPELWDPLTGEIRSLPQFQNNGTQTIVPLSFEPDQGYFIVFSKKGRSVKGNNFPEYSSVIALESPWEVTFDPKWGGPGKINFDQLSDWTEHNDDGIRYYSGTAVYEQTFDAGKDILNKNLYLDLGDVDVMARVSINGKEAGVVWTYPAHLDVSGMVREGQNELKIEVVNLWVNRLIGDDFLPDDGIVGGQWPQWLIDGTPRNSGRYTFTTWKHYTKDSPLSKSGLKGPVILKEKVN